jgi:hypothetical protein
VRPSRDTAAGRAYLDLQKRARADGQPTEALLVLYALEGFLARLAASGHSDKLVLKGGVLLAAFLVRRPTRDVDLQAQAMPNDTASVRDLVASIAASAPAGDDDGLVFDAEHATAEVIRDEDAYSGVRVSLTCTLHRANIHFHVDVNVGDPIWPEPEPVQLPRLLGGSARGTANTRWRDFGDVYVLSGTHEVTAADLRAAITAVAKHRQVELQPLADVLDGYELLAQTKYTKWRGKHRRDDLPDRFVDLLEAAIVFADPVLTDSAAATTWAPDRRTWQ